MATINFSMLNSKLDIYNSFFNFNNKAYNKKLHLKISKSEDVNEVGDGISSYYYNRFYRVNYRSVCIVNKNNTVIIFSPNNDKIKFPDDCKRLFSWLDNFETVDLTGADLSVVNKIDEMFYCCKSLKYIILDKSILKKFDLMQLKGIAKNCKSLEYIKVDSKIIKIKKNNLYCFLRKNINF